MNEANFDFVIIGAGTAGCVVASRLTEDPACRVLLIEAGGACCNPVSAVPLAFPLLAKNRELNWTYLGEAEERANGRKLAVRMGRGVGGSSLVNGMIYARGHPADYDDWAAQGMPGWNYAAVAPWFKRIENHWRGASEIHGGAGPVTVSRPTDPLPTTGHIISACHSLGIFATDDLSAPPHEGAARPEFSIDRRGRRVSTATAYLRHARRRPNLRVITGARVLRIVMESKRATGVEATIGRDVLTVRAMQEVILCAGAYESPRILMLSGIGDGGQLRDLGMRPCIDLPGVGANLQNHVTASTLHRVTGRTFHHSLRADRIVFAGLRWTTGGGGSLARVPLSATLFLRTRAGLDRPDIQAHYTEGSLAVRPWLPPFRAGLGDQLTVGNTLLRPRSKGWVRLASLDPLTPPRLKFNLLAEPDDALALCNSIGRQRQVFAQMARHGIDSSEVTPGASVIGDGLLAFVRTSATVSQHPVGTCAMGLGKEAVVDAELQVHGIAGLRVIDASIAPRLVGANTYAMTLMIAERGAAFVAAANGLTSAAREPEGGIS